MKIDGEPVSPYATNRFTSFRSVGFTSGKGQIPLKGWLIQTRTTPPRATLIIVHQQGGNQIALRVLPRRPCTASSLKAGFQILAFDLRHSGESGGEMSSFGYAEAEDVRHGPRVDDPQHVGHPDCSPTASVQGRRLFSRMMDQLQQNIDSEKIDGQPDTGSLSSSTLPATEIKKRICALVFDSPARDSDDYIRAVVRQENNRWLFWLKNTTPYAVRMSIGNSKKADYFLRVHRH